VIDVVREASEDLPRDDEESPAADTDVTGISQVVYIEMCV
jgi:hypothetical protein